MPCARPQAALAQCGGARGGRPRRRRTDARGSRIGRQGRARLQARGRRHQRDEAVLAMLDVDEALRAGDLGDRHDRRMRIASAHRRLQRKMMRPEADRVLGRPAPPAKAPAAACSSPVSSVTSGPLLTAGIVLSGGSENTCAVTRSSGRRYTCGVGPNWVIRPRTWSPYCRRGAAPRAGSVVA